MVHKLIIIHARYHYNFICCYARKIIIVGDNECGKTTLIAKLQGVEEPRKGIGLEYYYLNVKDEYRDGKQIK